MRDLDSAKYKQLRDAIVQAFPTKGALHQLIFYSTGKGLDRITIDGNIEDMVFNVIRWTEAQGCTDDLVNEAFKENEGNPALIRFRQEVWEPLVQTEKVALPQPSPPIKTPSDKIDLSEGVFLQNPMTNSVANNDAITLYYSYADEDARWLRLLQKQLSVLRRRGDITEWHRGMIELGEDEDAKRVRHLNEAQMIILLISPDFMITERTYYESEHAMRRHEAEGTVVIPIIVRPTADWRDTTFGKLQALPRTEKAIAEYSEAAREKILLEVATSVRNIVQNLRAKRL